MQQFEQVSVEYTGIGIAENDQDKFFKLFWFCSKP